MKWLCGNQSKNSIPPLIENGVSYSNDSAKANLLCEYFTEQCTLPPEPENFSLPSFEYLTMNRLDSIEINENSVMEVLGKLNPNKACGPDGISNRLLKNCAHSLARPLTCLFTECLETQKYPTDWKKANSSPIFKKSHRFIKTNYRPISLLACPSKVFERLIFNDMYDYFVEGGLLTARNSGFKKLDSTVNQLIHLCDSIYKGLDKYNDMCAVFLDVSKAFDKVYHRGLLFKLKQLGISGKLLGLLESYLENRKHRVVINGSTSDWMTFNAGVPQGSILGPLLFLVYINDLVDNIESNIYLFADDTSILHELDNNDLTTSFQLINRDLQKIFDWSTQWRVQFNALKSSYIVFSKRQHRDQWPNVTMGNSNILECQTHCHLGVHLNNTMTWNTHIDSIAKKASKRVFSMKRLSKLVPRKSLINIYKTLIRPIMEYACVVFDNIPECQSLKLDSIQRSAAISCTGAYNLTNSTALINEIGWESLKIRRKFQRLMLFFKILNLQTPTYLLELTSERIESSVHYGLRDRHDLRQPSYRLVYSRKSYIPKTTKDWNLLAKPITNLTSLTTFRVALKNELFKIKENKLYDMATNNHARYLAQMRMGLSGLRSHLMQIKVIESAMCEKCHSEVEDCCHFLLRCDEYITQRRELFRDIVMITEPTYWTTRSEENITKILLYSSDDFPYEIAFKIQNFVITYIESTERFKRITP